MFSHWVTTEYRFHHHHFSNYHHQQHYNHHYYHQNFHNRHHLYRLPLIIITPLKIVITNIIITVIIFTITITSLSNSWEARKGKLLRLFDIGYYDCLLTHHYLLVEKLTKKSLGVQHQSLLVNIVSYHHFHYLLDEIISR